MPLAPLPHLVKACGRTAEPSRRRPRRRRLHQPLCTVHHLKHAHNLAQHSRLPSPGWTRKEDVLAPLGRIDRAELRLIKLNLARTRRHSKGETKKRDEQKTICGQTKRTHMPNTGQNTITEVGNLLNAGRPMQIRAVGHDVGLMPNGIVFAATAAAKVHEDDAACQQATAGVNRKFLNVNGIFVSMKTPAADAIMAHTNK